jgi:hypothetical protein
MPTLIAALIGGLVQAAMSLVGRVLVGFGIGLVTYAGVSVLFNNLKTLAFSYMDQAVASASVGQWIGVFKIGTCMNILFSAVLVRLTLSGLTSGTVKRWITK